MAGKKKVGKKGGGAKKGPTIIDGVAVSDMTREQLEGHLERVKEELNREREERNYHQLERDKINTFWEISRQQVDDLRTDLSNRDRTMENAELAHRKQMNILQQKIKHLQYEHQMHEGRLKSEYHEELRQSENQHSHHQAVTSSEKYDLRQQLHDQQLAQEELVRNMKLSHAAALSQRQQQLESVLHDAQAKHEQRQESMREQLQLQRRVELRQLEERKNAHISKLTGDHEHNFNQIKAYYKQITANNLALISALKEQLEETKKREERTNKQMNVVEQHNSQLTQSLNSASDQVNELEKQLKNYHKDKRFLNQTSARLKKLTKEHEAVAWEKEILEQRYDKVEKERTQVYDRFVEAINEVHQKAGMRSVLLERKVTALAECLEKKEAQLNEVLLASNLDPAALGLINRKLEDILDVKNSAIKELKLQLAQFRNQTVAKLKPGHNKPATNDVTSK